MATKRNFGWLLLITVVFYALSCTGKLKYEPQIQKVQLLNIRGKQLAVLPVAYDEKAILYPANDISMEVRKAVLEAQAKSLGELFATQFQIVTIAADKRAACTLDKSQMNEDHAKQIANLLSVDALLWARTALDFTMNNFRTSVESYYFASEVRIYDREGMVVWSYYSKGTCGSSLKDLIKPSEFIRGILAMNPAQQTQAANLSDIMQQHSAFVAWLLGNQINDRPERNYVKQYPKYNRRLMITPPDANYAPSLNDL